MNSEMDAQMDLLCFDLMDFDMKHPVFPFNAAAFIVEMTAISSPPDHVPVLKNHYAQRIGETNSFQAVTFYSDFTRVMNQREITSDMKQSVVNFFEISFVPDSTIDLLCAEAFQRPSPSITSQPLPSKRAQPQCTTKQSLHSKKSPQKLSPQRKAKRSKNYDEPILRTRCDNCKDKDLRMKLTKKILNCNVADLMKFVMFWNGLKMEKAQLATLPPVNEIDHTLHQELITLMENRGIEEYYYLNESLPECLNKIKLHWYENMHTITQIINVPDTTSDVSS